MAAFRVRLLERGRVASEQSSRALGFIRQQGRDPTEGPLAASAARLWQGLERELQADLEYENEGIVMAAETREDEHRLEEAFTVAQANGIMSRMLTGEQTAALAPATIAPWRAGLFTPGDGHAEPVKATLAFAKACRNLGVDIHEDMAATGLEISDGKAVGVVTKDDRYEAGVVLCAAGIGAAELSRTAGISLPVLVVRAPVSQTNRARPVTKIPFWCPHVAFRPKRDGSYYIGNGYREIDAEFDITVDVLRHGLKFAPTFVAQGNEISLRLGRAFIEDMERRLRPRKVFDHGQSLQLTTNSSTLIGVSS